MAGVHFFPPPLFADQEPSGDQRQGDVVVPPSPGANLIIGQARFALGTLDTVFNSVVCLGHASEFFERRFAWCIRQIVVMLERAFFAVSNNDENLGFTNSSPLRAATYTTLHDVYG